MRSKINKNKEYQFFNTNATTNQINHPQDKYPAITHPVELLYNSTTLPRFPYYTNQPPYLLQTTYNKEGK